MHIIITQGYSAMLWPYTPTSLHSRSAACTQCHLSGYCIAQLQTLAPLGHENCAGQRRCKLQWLGTQQELVSRTDLKLELGGCFQIRKLFSELLPSDSSRAGSRTAVGFLYGRHRRQRHTIVCTACQRQGCPNPIHRHKRRGSSDSEQEALEQKKAVP